MVMFLTIGLNMGYFVTDEYLDFGVQIISRVYDSHYFDLFV